MKEFSKVLRVELIGHRYLTIETTIVLKYNYVVKLDGIIIMSYVARTNAEKLFDAMLELTSLETVKTIN